MALLRRLMLLSLVAAMLVSMPETETVSAETRRTIDESLV